jgi:hypothetical protein
MGEGGEEMGEGEMGVILFTLLFILGKEDKIPRAIECNI